MLTGEYLGNIEILIIFLREARFFVCYHLSDVQKLLPDCGTR